MAGGAGGGAGAWLGAPRLLAHGALVMQRGSGLRRGTGSLSSHRQRGGPGTPRSKFTPGCLLCFDDVFVNDILFYQFFSFFWN